MINPKNVLGISATAKDFQGRQFLCEVLEADGDRLRIRVSSKGDVFESSWSPENLRQPKTWKNGVELPPGSGEDRRDMCLCAVLRQVYGEEFSGYEHNYAFAAGTAWEKQDGDDRDEFGRRWGRCPYCEQWAWLGYKDHCPDCLR